MYRRLAFGGLTEPQPLPSGYKRLQRRHGAELEERTLLDVMDVLAADYDVEWRDLFHYDAGGNPSNVSNYRCLVNPQWEDIPVEDIPGDREDAVWHIPTRSYTRVPHRDAWEPMLEALDRRADGEDVFGVARLRQHGGEVHLDVFNRTARVDAPASAEDLVLGIATGQDYLGGTRLYVDSVAYHDTGDGIGQIMRDLTDARKRKHTGNAGSHAAAWFDDAFERLEEVSETLYDVMAEAMHYEVPTSEIPCSTTQFYEHLGLPNKKPDNLADHAAERSAETSAGAVTAYHLYKAGMWAIEHEYDSRDTTRFTQHVEAVNTLLFNPALAERRVLSEVEDELEEAEADGSIYEYTEEEPGATIETVRTRAENISDGVENFRTTREKLRTMLEDDGVEVSE